MGVMDEWNSEKAKSVGVAKLSEEVRQVSEENNLLKDELLTEQMKQITNRTNILK